MNLLLIWILTILISFTNVIKLANKIIFDCYKSGYKIEIENSTNEKTSKLKFYLALVTPGINIVKTLEPLITYNSEEIINSFAKYNALKKMTLTEQQTFNDNPTISTAYLLLLKPYLGGSLNFEGEIYDVKTDVEQEKSIEKVESKALVISEKQKQIEALEYFKKAVLDTYEDRQKNKELGNQYTLK